MVAQILMGGKTATALRALLIIFCGKIISGAKAGGRGIEMPKTDGAISKLGEGRLLFRNAANGAEKFHSNCSVCPEPAQ
jgi:hypothetical protein